MGVVTAGSVMPSCARRCSMELISGIQPRTTLWQGPAQPQSHRPKKESRRDAGLLTLICFREPCWMGWTSGGSVDTAFGVTRQSDATARAFAEDWLCGEQPGPPKLKSCGC